MLAASCERRREKRVGAAIAVHLATATGVTRDVSESGMFFDTDTRFAVGEAIDMELELNAPHGKLLFRCCGEVLRVEPRDRKFGVAVRLAGAAMFAH